MKQYSAKQHEAFNSKVRDIVTKTFKGEKIEEANMERYEMKSTLGKLIVSIPQADKSSVFSVYLRFEDDKKALLHFGYNQVGYSGKWNVHEYTESEAITMLKYKLSVVTECEVLPF